MTGAVSHISCQIEHSNQEASRLGLQLALYVQLPPIG